MRCGERKHNLGKWPEIPAVFRLGDSFHAELFVALPILVRFVKEVRELDVTVRVLTNDGAAF
jgi:hypothetical protein